MYSVWASGVQQSELNSCTIHIATVSHIGCYMTLSQPPCAIREVPVSYRFHIWLWIWINPKLPVYSFPKVSFPFGIPQSAFEMDQCPKQEEGHPGCHAKAWEHSLRYHQWVLKISPELMPGSISARHSHMPMARLFMMPPLWTKQKTLCDLSQPLLSRSQLSSVAIQLCGDTLCSLLLAVAVSSGNGAASSHLTHLLFSSVYRRAQVSLCSKDLGAWASQEGGVGGFSSARLPRPALGIFTDLVSMPGSW